MVKKIQLLLFLGIFFCFFSTTSQAYMSRDYFDYCLDTLSTNFYYYNDQHTNNARNNLNNLTEEKKLSIFNTFNNYLDQYNLSTIEDLNIIATLSDVETTTSYLYFIICNNSYPNGNDNLDFFKLNYMNCYPYSNNSTEHIYCFRIKLTDLSYKYFYTLPGDKSRLDMNFFNYSDYYSFNNDNSVLYLRNVACCGAPSGYCYIPFNSTTSIIPVILSDYNGNYQLPTPPEPEEPSGDISSSTGTITNNSGETTGSINLSGIEQGITGIQNTISGESQRIIDTQNQNTQTIVNTISGETNNIINNITGTTTNIDPEDKFDDMLSSTSNVVDPTTNFFSWLIDNIRSVLNSTGNYDLDISFRGETITIRSDFFVLPEGDFKTFLQLSFICWFGWSIFKKIRYIVYAVKCVNISSALNHSDFNADIL